MHLDEALLSRIDATPDELRDALVGLARDLSLHEDPPPSLRRYSTAFVDALLANGKPTAAHVAAALAVSAGRDLAAPPSSGRDRLHGAAELDSSPYRGLISATLTLLGELARRDRSQPRTRHPLAHRAGSGVNCVDPVSSPSPASLVMRRTAGVMQSLATNQGAPATRPEPSRPRRGVSDGADQISGCCSPKKRPNHPQDPTRLIVVEAENERERHDRLEPA